MVHGDRGARWRWDGLMRWSRSYRCCCSLKLLLRDVEANCIYGAPQRCGGSLKLWLLLWDVMAHVVAPQWCGGSLEMWWLILGGVAHSRWGGSGAMVNLWDFVSYWRCGWSIEMWWLLGYVVAHWRWGGSTRRGGSLVMEGHIGGWGARWDVLDHDVA